MLGVLIPVWGRPTLSGRVLAWWSGPSFDFCYRVAVVSPEDPSPPTIPPQFGIVEAPNRMQTKWQAGLDAMRGRVDSVMMMGSDDLATPGLVRRLYDAARLHGMAYPHSLYTANAATGDIVHGLYGTVYAGCTYSADTIERAGGRIFVSPKDDSYPPDVVSALACRPHARPFRLPPCHEMGEAVVDIKDGQGMWPYELVERRIRRHRVRDLPCPTADDFFATHFPQFEWRC